MTIEIMKDLQGNDVVFITNEDGSTLSMLKSAYDEQQVEHLTEIVPANE
jgi:hypothetical protein